MSFAGSLPFGRLAVCAYMAIPFFPFARARGADGPQLDIAQLVKSWKRDSRGPFSGINWFCPDGRVIPAQQRCGQPGGLQHGRHRPEIERIARERAIHLAQILAGLDPGDFLAPEGGYARAVQYQIERFLIEGDDGWILRRAQYYRGAFQAEDEEAWGRKILLKAYSEGGLHGSRFYLARELARDVPHAGRDTLVETIRSLSKAIAEAAPGFGDIRIKIHGRPDASDLGRVRDFKTKKGKGLSAEVSKKLAALEKSLWEFYAVWESRKLAAWTQAAEIMGWADGWRAMLKSFQDGTVRVRVETASNWIYRIRSEWGRIPPANRLLWMDASLELEAALLRHQNDWKPASPGEHLQKILVLARALVGCGFLEFWEWEETRRHFPDTATGEVERSTWDRWMEIGKRVAGWSIAMAEATYREQVRLFETFEPLAAGFLDDRVRRSALMAYSSSWSSLAAQTRALEARGNQDHYFPAATGLNPGIAEGPLAVAGGSQAIAYDENKIYLFTRTPGELKPVRGILTLSEGNPASHVQLLARNLGIPNAVVHENALAGLSDLDGKRIFLAVSPGGRVRLCPWESATTPERELATAPRPSEKKMTIPVGDLELDHLDLTSLSRLRARHSGGICGPKAANLGELKKYFPDAVAEGFIIPFGWFGAHLDSPGAGGSPSIRKTLEGILSQPGSSSPAAEKNILEALARVREGLLDMDLDAEFIVAVQKRFAEVFGRPMGQVGVFLRSDTNMEDLKGFTGAGLNLTVPNVRDEDAFWAALKQVWASVYSERSYKWRQRVLTNPLEIYASVLVLETVAVDRSGVLLTQGLFPGMENGLTVAFSRGLGGAVDGQSSETWLLPRKGGGAAFLLSPARELAYRVPDAAGGMRTRPADLTEPVLDAGGLERLQKVALQVEKKMRAAGMDPPLDIELGFEKGNLRLFQVRPLVENRSLRTLKYLRDFDDIRPTKQKVQLDQPG